jgi:hypothetical protein
VAADETGSPDDEIACTRHWTRHPQSSSPRAPWSAISTVSLA